MPGGGSVCVWERSSWCAGWRLPHWLGVDSGFVGMARALGFHCIMVWICGLGSREGTGFYVVPQIWILMSIFFQFNFAFSEHLVACNGDSISFQTSLFSWPGLGLLCSRRPVAGWCPEPIWFVPD